MTYADMEVRRTLLVVPAGGAGASGFCFLIVFRVRGTRLGREDPI